MDLFPGSTRGRKKHPFDEDEDEKRASQKKTTALHGCINFILACSTEKKHAYDGCLLGFRDGFFTEKCQQNVNILRVWYGLRLSTWVRKAT